MLLCLFIKIGFFCLFEYDLIPRNDFLEESDELFDCFSGGLDFIIKCLLDKNEDSPSLQYTLLT